MANFFSDIFDSVSGQQVAPQQTIIPTSDLLSQSYQTATGQIPALTAYNNALAPALAQSQLSYEAAVNPYANQVRSGAYKSILDQLNLGTALPQDLQDQVINSALGQAANSGFGVGQGGRGLVAADLGLTGLQLQRERQNAALGAAGGLALTGAAYSPSRGFQPQEIAADIQGEASARDEMANLQEDIRRKNFASLLNTGGRILGTAAGAYFSGGNPMAAKMGGDIGGSLITGSGVRGQESAAQNKGGMFTSILSGMGGLFNGGGANTGGSFGSGAGSGAISNFGRGSTSLDASIPTNGPFR